jgi:hypothetical protein
MPRHTEIAAAILALLAAVNPALCCSLPSQIKPSLYEHKPEKDNIDVIANVKVIELIEPFRFKDTTGQETGPLVSFRAAAKVIESVKGVNNGQVIEIISETSSCNTPFQLDVVGYIAGRSHAASSGGLVVFTD